MKDKLLRFPFTSAAAMFAVFVVSAALIGDINLIEFPVLIMNRIEKHEVDEIFTAFLLVIVALTVDQIRTARREKREAQRQAEQRKAELQAEQVRVVQVTMRTVQDIVNNCLNQLQLLRLDAEDIVPAESLRLFDEAIQQASSQLKTLGDLEVFAESQMAVGSGLDASIRARA